MGMFKNWKEYLDHRGVLVEKPKVDHSPTYTGPAPKSPKKEDKAKTTPKSYRPSKEHKPEKAEKGFTDVKVPENKPDKNQKTEDFISKTRGMPLAEFTSYMLKECGCGGKDEKDKRDDDTLPTVTSYATGKFHPYPPEAIRYVAALAKKNPRIMEGLIQELKKQDAYSDLLSSSMDHPETYTVLTDLFGDDDEGPQRSRSLARAMDDKYSKFIDDQSDMFSDEDDDDLEEAVAPPYGINDDDDNEDDDNTTSYSDNPDDDDEMTAGDENDPTIDDQDQDDPDAVTQDQDAGEENDDEIGRTDLSHDELTDSDTTTDSDSKPSAPVPPIRPSNAPPMRKVKKKFAHDHLLDAMSKHDHMRDKMKDYSR